MEQNKKVMERFVEFINTGNMEIGREIIAPNVIFYAPTSPEPMTGLEGYAAVLNMMRGAMPDVHWTVEETIAEGSIHHERHADTPPYGNPRHRKIHPRHGDEHL